MDLPVSEGAPPPVRKHSTSEWSRAKAAAIALAPGQNVTIREGNMPSMRTIPGVAAKQCGGKFTCRTNADGSVTIYRTA